MSLTVSGIMPAKGRPDQTRAAALRILQQAAYPLELIVVTDEDPETALLLRGLPGIRLLELPERRGYWKALSYGAQAASGTLLLNLANDLKPGMQWLDRGVRAYQAAFGDGAAVLGLNDGVHEGNHAGHVLAHRDVLHHWYGQSLYPVMYDHLYGDTEIVIRAMEEGRWGYAAFAVLYHDHPANGAPSDAVYALGHRREAQDRQLFWERRRSGWQAG